MSPLWGDGCLDDGHALRQSMASNLASRLSRLLPGGRGLWIPIDHGLSSYPVEGLENTDDVVNAVIAGGADAIVCQKGMLFHQRGRTKWDGFVCHVSASTVHGGDDAQTKVTVADPMECVHRGAMALSGQVNLGSKGEMEMIQNLGALTTAGFEIGMPVLGMVYPRGPNLVEIEGDDTGGVAHAARLAFEIGCSVVKVPWTGSVETFRKVCEAVPIPVMIAGGPKGVSFEETLAIVAQSLEAGGSGVCMGRQVFGSSDPTSCVLALNSLIHEGADIESAVKFLDAEVVG